ncbi:hypothetical protein SEA_CAMERICO_100 [Gordonia phage Camerico]|nr:hypothetical protein SEA_CAMERICO_100 [Gordonia phage Camerico]
MVITSALNRPRPTDFDVSAWSDFTQSIDADMSAAPEFARRLMSGLLAMHFSLMALNIAIDNNLRAGTPISTLTRTSHEQLRHECVGAAKLLTESGYGAPENGVITAHARDVFFDIRNDARELIAFMR